MGLHLFSPAVTLAIYAIQAQLSGERSIDISMVFTSLAIIDIVATPANGLLGSLPGAASVIAAFDRIQIYLLNPGREDKRGFTDNQDTNDDLGAFAPSSEGNSLGPIAVKLGHVSIRPVSTAETCLKNINTALKKGSLVVVCGAVGTGKTTLAKAILGDLPPDSGNIQLANKSIAYCSQTAWLINRTVKEVIRGPSGNKSPTDVDEKWYKRVLQACDLDKDLELMPHGDQASVGSRGSNLSGGQKQRVVSTTILVRILV